MSKSDIVMAFLKELGRSLEQKLKVDFGMEGPEIAILVDESGGDRGVLVASNVKDVDEFLEYVLDCDLQRNLDPELN